MKRLVLQVGSVADDASNEALETYGDAYKVLSDDSERAAYDKQRISSQVFPMPSMFMKRSGARNFPNMHAAQEYLSRDTLFRT